MLKLKSKCARALRRHPLVSGAYVTDWLRARDFLSPARRSSLAQRFQRCATPDAWYDAAQEMIPSHQVRSELVAFLNFAAADAPETIVEIGTGASGTHFLLSNALPSVRVSLALDIHVLNTRLLRHFGRSDLRKLHLNASSYAPRTAAKVKKMLQGRPIDLLFIDGDHSYQGVKQDFMIYRELVRPGGLIAFHDIVADHKTRFGINTNSYTGDVPVLWKEIKPLHQETREFIENEAQDGYGIGVLRNDPSAAIA